MHVRKIEHYTYVFVPDVLDLLKNIPLAFICCKYIPSDYNSLLKTFVDQLWTLTFDTKLISETVTLGFVIASNILPFITPAKVNLIILKVKIECELRKGTYLLVI